MELKKKLQKWQLESLREMKFYTIVTIVVYCFTVLCYQLFLSTLLMRRIVYRENLHRWQRLNISSCRFCFCSELQIQSGFSYVCYSIKELCEASGKAKIWISSCHWVGCQIDSCIFSIWNGFNEPCWSWNQSFFDHLSSVNLTVALSVYFS